MRIGIDLGGSHIAIGTINNGKIIKKSEHNFSQEEKNNLEKTLKVLIPNMLENFIKEYRIRQHRNDRSFCTRKA